MKQKMMDKTSVNRSSFYTLLDREHSKAMATHIVDLILEDEGRMEELMDCFLHDEWRICQRAAYSIAILTDKKPALLAPYIGTLISNLDDPHHDAVFRNTYRALIHLDIPEDLEGQLFDKAFDSLCNIDLPIAIRVFAMTICTNMAMKYPELKGEVISVIETHYPHESKGYKSRAKRELKRLRK